MASARIVGSPSGAADQSCERQITEFDAFAERGGYEVVAVFKGPLPDPATTVSRNRGLKLAQARWTDAVLVVTELSRWGRSTLEFLDAPLCNRGTARTTSVADVHRPALFGGFLVPGQPRAGQDRDSAARSSWNLSRRAP